MLVPMDDPQPRTGPVEVAQIIHVKGRQVNESTAEIPLASALMRVR